MPAAGAERRPEEALPISLLLVIDRSGSMEGEPLRMAVLAAESAASTLAPTDRVGVISFADDPTLDVPMRPAGDVAAGGLVRVPRADGNTEILLALGSAEAQLGRPDAVEHLSTALDDTTDPRTLAAATANLASASISFSSFVRRDNSTGSGSTLYVPSGLTTLRVVGETLIARPLSLARASISSSVV